MKLKKRILFFLTMCAIITDTTYADTRWPVTYLNPGLSCMIEGGGFYYKVMDAQVDPIENTTKTSEVSFRESNKKPLFFGELSWTTENRYSLYTSAESPGDEQNVKAGLVRAGQYNQLESCIQYKKERVLKDPYSNDELFLLTWLESWKATIELDGIAMTNTGIWYSCQVLAIRDDLPEKRDKALSRGGIIHKAGVGYQFKAGLWVMAPSIELSCGVTEGSAGRYLGYGLGLDVEYQGERSILALNTAAEVDSFRSAHPVYKAKQRDLLAEIKLSYTVTELFNTDYLYATYGAECNILTTENDLYERKTVSCFFMGGLRFE